MALTTASAAAYEWNSVCSTQLRRFPIFLWIFFLLPMSCFHTFSLGMYMHASFVYQTGKEQIKKESVKYLVFFLLIL